MENKEFLQVEMTEGPDGQAEGVSLTSGGHQRLLNVE